MIWIWLCGYLFVFWICIFFNKYFGFLYLDLLILYQKAKGSKIINFFFFEKIKICTNPAQTQSKNQIEKWF
jgi:hypothetical protein